MLCFCSLLGLGGLQDVSLKRDQDAIAASGSPKVGPLRAVRIRRNIIYHQKTVLVTQLAVFLSVNRMMKCMK